MKILKCVRCNREWVSKMDNPYRCGKCKSPYWDRPRVSAKRIMQSPAAVGEMREKTAIIDDGIDYSDEYRQ